MRVRALFLMATALLLISVQVGLADPTEKRHEVIDAEGVENIDVEIDFAAGDLILRAADQLEAAVLDVEYSPEWVDYDIRYRARNKTGVLTLESDLIGRHRDREHDDIDNLWDLTLSSRYNTIIDIDMGACDANLDLGGLRLRGLHMDVGASSGRIDFSEPNHITMEDMDIDVGASSLDIVNLGNAHAERIDFSCGAASCELDFRGDFQGETTLDIDVGVGSADIVVPEGVAVRIIGEEGWFSSIDIHGIELTEIDDDLRESSDFATASKRLVIRLDVGMGSVDIYGSR